MFIYSSIPYYQITSTTTSQAFGLSWPYGAGAVRLLMIFREQQESDGGSFLGYLQSPYQLEVTFAPGMIMTTIACEQKSYTTQHGAKAQIGLSYVVVGANATQLSSDTYRNNVISYLKRQFDVDQRSCSPLFCAFDYSMRATPRVHECSNGGMINNDPFQAVPNAECVRTSSVERDAFRLADGWVAGQGVQAQPQCVTDITSDGATNDYFAMRPCVRSAQRQRFLFDDENRLHFNKLSTNLCASNYGAKFYAGSDFRLWTCNQPTSDDQRFLDSRRYNGLLVQTDHNGVDWCLQGSLKFDLCNAHQYLWVLVPVNVTLP